MLGQRTPRKALFDADRRFRERSFADNQRDCNHSGSGAGNRRGPARCLDSEAAIVRNSITDLISAVERIPRQVQCGGQQGERKEENRGHHRELEPQLRGAGEPRKDLKKFVHISGKKVIFNTNLENVGSLCSSTTRIFRGLMKGMVQRLQTSL